MVKAVQAEESISEYFDGLLKNRVQAEVGLIVGKPSVGSRDLALAVVPTTSQDGEQVLIISQGSAASAAKAKKAGPKVKSNEPAVSIDLESELIAEHALQASRMLPGGLAVLGLYLFAPESGYNSASSQLCSTLAAIAADSSSSSMLSASKEAAAAAAALTAEVSGISAPSAVGSVAGPQELLLLHVDSSSRKFTMRSCQVNSAATAASTLKPTELKFGPSLSSLVCLRCSHSFDFSFPASSSQEQLLQQAVAAESARVTAAVAALDGKVPASSSQPLTELLPASAGSGAADATRVELLCLPHAAAALRSPGAAAGKVGSSSSNVLGSCRLHGTVESLAYVHKRDPVGKALHDLKSDVINSLAARLQLLEDDAAAAADEAKQDAAGAAAHPLLAAGAGKRSRVGLARRVLLPCSSLGLQVCDYLSEADGAEAALEQAQQQLQLTGLQASQVLELEAPAAKKPKIVAGTAMSEVAAGAAGSGGASCSAAVLGAAAAGVVAALAVGMAYVNLGQ
uniref:ODR-4-like protein n=1 Tax=Tetradesmus obliquus TaxID=3088 RepID=A0A383W0M2_TETOB|eukprot:jgi/Sobl393_1/18086/SZX71041.1